MKSNEIKDILSELSQRPIAIFPVYIDIAGSVTAGLLLSQIIYWHTAVKREFFKTDAEIMEETRLSAGELRAAKKAIKALGIVSIKVKGIPAKTFYDVNYENLLSEIRKTSLVKLTKLDSSNSQNRLSEFNETITENTTENTTETTTENANAKAQAQKKSGKIEIFEDEAFRQEMEDFAGQYVNVPYELQKMQDYLANSTRRYRDFKAFARNWLRRCVEQSKEKHDAKKPAAILKPETYKTVRDRLKTKYGHKYTFND
jgi:hypothetical protein